jgi:parvulin-like peptidyl-prolyl isomerase
VHRILLRITLCVFIIAFSAACASADPAIPTANPLPDVPTIAPDVLPTDSAGLPLAARVNGEGIRLAEFERALARAQVQQLAAADVSTLRVSVLTTLIEEVLMRQDAAQQGIAVTDAEVDAELATYVSASGGDAAWQEWLSQNMFTADEFRQTIRVSLLYTRMITTVTANLNGDVPHVHARHILVASEAEANALLARLQAGEDFAALASLSLDSSNREQGGDLGWFTQDELIDPVLGTIAFSLETGQIAGPIRTTLGYHIIQTLERADQPLTDERRAQLAQKQFETWLASLAASANIERFI